MKPATSKITLVQDQYRNTAAGTPLLGTPQYKITEQPEHGTLVTGTPDAQGWFSGASVEYKKDGAYNGPDDFKFAVKQANSQFPLNPASAAVMLQVGSGNGDTAVGISGAPAWVYTAQGAQLTGAITPDDGSKPDLGRGRRAGRQRHRRHDRRERVLQGPGEGSRRRQGADHRHGARRCVRRGRDRHQGPPGAAGHPGPPGSAGAAEQPHQARPLRSSRCRSR